MTPPGVAALPAAPGAYALALRLPRARRIVVGALGPVAFPRGCYLYLGSARGPGGIRARLGRHLRGGERRRWHVDHLAAAAEVAGGFAVPGGRECALVRRLLAVPGVSVPAPGFGSSDCPRCPAHLLRLPDGLCFSGVASVLDAPFHASGPAGLG